VNEDGYGMNNAYTFLRMSGTTTVDGQIDYGFKSEPEQLHVIASQWLWDWNVLNLVYDSLIRRNPYEQSQVECFLATNVSVGTWEMDGGELGTELTFDLRDSVKWHDGMPFTAQDVVFSWNFTKACSPRVAWNYAFVTDMNNSWVSGPNQVKIRYNVLSMFAKWWAGSLPIIPKHIWEGRFPDWNQPTFNPSIVRAYHPWEVEKVVSNETLTEMVGTGPWKYPLGGWIKGVTIELTAFTDYYFNVSDVDALLVDSFWKYKGDATAKVSSPYDLGRISGSDILLLVANYGANYAPSDFNENGEVDAEDFSLVTSNFGKIAG
jgi:ABC-type transport system substrate-binding protein